MSIYPQNYIIIFIIKVLKQTVNILDKLIFIYLFSKNIKSNIYILLHGYNY